MNSLSQAGRRVTVARRITLLGGLFLLVVLGAICAVMAAMLAKRSEERTVSWVDAKVGAIAQALDAHDATARLLVDRFFKVFDDQFGRNFELDEAGGKLRQLGIALNGYHNPCDKFTEFTGGAAAVLMRQADGFVAISTSLKDGRGERALDLRIGAAHPAYAALLRDQPYLGRAMLYGRSYVTRLRPVHDLQNHVVGALFVAFDLTEFDRSLDRLVAGTRLFDSGGVYIVDPHVQDGRPVLGLPAALAGRPLPGGETTLKAFQVAAPGAALDGLPSALRADGSARMVVARHSEATGYWVVGEFSRAEALREQWQTLLPFLALFGIATLALCVGQYQLIRRWVGEPLRVATTALARVAGGDLSQPVLSTRVDEIGEMMRGVEGLRLRFVQMLGAVRESTEAIAAASTQIAGGNQDLSHRTEDAAARLQQTTSAMEQICGKVREASSAAGTADGLAHGASNAAQRGSEAVGQMVSTMAAISTSSQRIGDITAIIDAIAFQTNLLALNAAVEAARAGDSGRGFAVVAGEVRALAQRSASAAREIKELVRQSADEVRAGSQLATAASARMNEILGSVRSVNDSLGTISASAAEQSEGLGEVSDAVSTLDRMTQQNAALVEQSAAAAESLKQQSQRLVEAMRVFQF
jgi:methyl-accepting chemotaxis protein-2 (aspartate sensor receptor)